MDCICAQKTGRGVIMVGAEGARIMKLRGLLNIEVNMGEASIWHAVNVAGRKCGMPANVAWPLMWHARPRACSTPNHVRIRSAIERVGSLAQSGAAVPQKSGSPFGGLAAVVCRHADVRQALLHAAKIARYATGRMLRGTSFSRCDPTKTGAKSNRIKQNRTELNRCKNTISLNDKELCF